MTKEEKKINKVCVYCASSNQTGEDYILHAKDLGRILAQNNISIVYGGGKRGLMGYMADSAMENGGKVFGVMPEFMVKQEWMHEGITELKIVKTMHERKALMIKDTDAVIALPGGSGTLEELLEVITLKRLGMYNNPIILINTCRFYDDLSALFERMVKEKFIDQRHKDFISIIDEPAGLFEAIKEAPEWSKDALNFAAL
jgi:uncharacterized protein (TIGR00730 family)